MNYLKNEFYVPNKKKHKPITNFNLKLHSKTFKAHEILNRYDANFDES